MRPKACPRVGPTVELLIIDDVDDNKDRDLKRHVNLIAYYEKILGRRSGC